MHRTMGGHLPLPASGEETTYGECKAALPPSQTLLLGVNGEPLVPWHDALK